MKKEEYYSINDLVREIADLREQLKALDEQELKGVIGRRIVKVILSKTKLLRSFELVIKRKPNRSQTEAK